MVENSLLLNLEDIKNRIHTVRGIQVMLDTDLAELYDVETKALNQAVKRNSERFPKGFMFQLTHEEFDYLKSKTILSNEKDLRSQSVTLKNGRGHHRKYPPQVFTEQGVAMLSGVLRSKTAIRVSIQVITAFVSMRKFITSNADVFRRLDNIEIKQTEYDKKFNELFDAIQNKNIKPEKGIFFEGQVFDAYRFVSDVIRTAEKSIILIDNYVDDSVLTLFNKRKKCVQVTILTKEIPVQLILDLNKYNQQYPLVEIKQFNKSHDRFLIIDNEELYHFGASLKDLGKKWFAFSKFNKEVLQLLDHLEIDKTSRDHK